MSLPLAHVGGGTLAPLQLLPALIAALLYVRRARTLAAAGKPVAVWRQLCFGSGLALILLTLASPLSHLSGELLLAHMGEHLLIGDVAALLIVLGLTGPLLQPLLAIKAIDRLRVLAHPLVALPLWAADLYVWHLPILYQATLHSEALHALEHSMFIVVGVLMWMPLVGPLPVPEWFNLPAKLGYLVAVRLTGTVLANAFMWSNSVFYPDYAPGEAYWNISPISDQGIAGVMMMAEGGLVTLGVLTWLFLRWSQQDTERQRLLDLAESRGVPLDAARASRAVAAGQGRRLEERLQGELMIASHRYLAAVVFVVGSASLGAEIAAARLMAPFFGASTIVWANTIAVVLVSLSVGYWLGGRWADRDPTVRGLCRLVLGAAALIAVIPFAARPFFSVSVDALDSISAGAFLGSLLGVLVLVAVPVMLLGACTPYALRLAITDVEHSGTVAGSLYAISTAGSLFGTMGAALLTIPLIGTQRTFLVFALALGAVAAVGLGWRYLAVPAAVAGVIAIPVGTVKAAEGEKVLFEGETTQEYVRVVQEQNGDVLLELNEGQATHSYYRPSAFLTDNYWDGLLVLPFAGGHGPPARVAILGNAAGTMARQYGHYYPETEIDAVEIDPKLTELGRRFFDLHNPRMRVHHEDARPWLERQDGDYDLIVVDAYRQPYIPFYLATKEFFELARDRLAPGGMVIVNVGHLEENDDLERVLGRTMAEVFPIVLRDGIVASNTLLVGSEAPASTSLLSRAIPTIPRELRSLALREAYRLDPRLPGGSVYTDDKAPVEWLIDKSIIGFAAGQ